MKQTMKTRQTSLLTCLLTGCSLLLAVSTTSAQTNILIHGFDDALEVTDNNGQPWINWFGTAYYQVLWDASDASNDVSSGSVRIEAFFPDSGIGGCCGPQFLAMNGYDGIQPPLAGNGNPGNVPVATNVSFDLRFDPMTDPNGSANWPTLEIQTRGVDFAQHTLGTVTLPVTETNWVHVDVPIAPSANWETIPNIIFKHYSGSRTNWVVLNVDNIVFTLSEVEVSPPTLAIEKAQPALRMLAGNSQYTRTQVATVDENQSWVGGSYPVSYSFTLSSYDINPSLNELHMFLIPMNHVQGGGLDQYTDYSTASNNFRLQITGGDYGTPTVFANLAYKTNTINANPNHVVASLTNNTATGTWSVTFDNSTDGTLTAPGGNSAAFSLPTGVAATFANPLVAVFGVQPNDPANLGQRVDFTHIQTANVAAPGVPVNTDFTTGSAIDTNVWRTASVSDDPANLILVDEGHPYWVNWNYPDIGFTLSTKADLADTGVMWKTPAYFTGYDTNNPIYKKTLGARVTTLIPEAALPTVDGSSNGIPGTAAFFRMENPAPAE